MESLLSLLLFLLSPLIPLSPSFLLFSDLSFIGFIGFINPGVCRIVLNDGCGNFFFLFLWGQVIHVVLVNFDHLVVHEQKPLFPLLMDMLSIRDSFQMQRLQGIMQGLSATVPSGLFAQLLRSKTRRPVWSYLIIKFIVQLVSKVQWTQAYLFGSDIYPSWIWAVTWLQNQLARTYSTAFDVQQTYSNTDNPNNLLERTERWDWKLSNEKKIWKKPSKEDEKEHEERMKELREKKATRQEKRNAEEGRSLD